MGARGPVGLFGRTSRELDLVLDTGIVLAACLSSAGFRPLNGYRLHSLDFMWWEAESILHEYVWRLSLGWPNPQWPGLTIADFQKGFTNLKEAVGSRPEPTAGSVVESVPFSGPLADDAWQVAERCGFAKVYDAAYVALARRLGCPLATLDARLIRSPAARLATIKGPADI